MLGICCNLWKNFINVGINSYVYDTELFEDAPVEVVDEREYFEQRYGKWHPGFAVNVDNQIFSNFINAMVEVYHLAKLIMN